MAILRRSSGRSARSAKRRSKGSCRSRSDGALQSVTGHGDRALLLDCDGTIVETERDCHRVAFNQAFAKQGFKCAWGVDLYGELLKTAGGKERMARYFRDINSAAWPHGEPPTKDHPTIRELHSTKTQIFTDVVRSGQQPLREGIEKVLGSADAAGWQLGVCSTSDMGAVTAVVETMLPRFARKLHIFAGDLAKAKKPDPEIYLLASQALGVRPEACVAVEDAAIGAKAAKAAGMTVIVTKSFYSVDEDFEGADLVLSSAADIDFERDVVGKA